MYSLWGSETLIPARKCARPDCVVIFNPKIAKRKYCCRPCANWAKAQNQRGQKQGSRRSEFTVETGPPITPGIDELPACSCGRPMHVGTDRLGRTILECSECGAQLVTIVGTHRYDQRERLTDELEQLITRGKRRVKKSSDVVHHKGLAAYTGSAV